MATTEELFISVPSKLYIEGKSANLMGQAELLHSLKRIQNLKLLSKKRTSLKKKLQKVLSEISSGISLMQKSMPTPNIPKTINVHQEPEPKPKPKIEIKPQPIQELKPKPISKKDQIEEELTQIQEKLKQINSNFAQVA